MTCHTSIRASGSRPVVGSSRKSTFGCPIRLIAMSSRRRMPPEYVDTLREAASMRLKRARRSSATWPGSLQVPQLGDEHQVLPAGEDLVDRGELAGQADGLPDSERVRRDVVPVDGGRAGVRAQQRGQDPHDRGLPGPVRAEQGEDAARCHLEVHPLQDVQVPVGLLDVLSPGSRAREPAALMLQSQYLSCAHDRRPACHRA